MDTATTQPTPTPEQATEIRKQRGLQIARRMRIVNKRPGLYIVPSQSTGGHYAVTTEPDGTTECTCPDFDLRRSPCKHIHAVTYTRQAEVMPDGSQKVIETLKITYQQDSRAYNAAQCNEKEYVAKLLRGLCDGLEEPAQTNGRPRLPLADRVFAVTAKVYTGFSSRRADTDQRMWADAGYMSKAPSFSSVCDYMGDPKLAAVLTRLVEISAAPLASVESQFAVDSSGFSTQGIRRWIDHKYGKQHEEVEWIKAHICVGTRTNIVTTARVTASTWHDSPELPALVENTAKRFTLKEVSADKGYLSYANMDAIAAVGAEPFIAFKENSTDDGARVTELWKRMFGYFQYKRQEYLAHYNRRSNVETTFHMVKSKFGDFLRSKTRAAQRNELLCKLLCHNLSVIVHEMFGLGIVPEFWPEGPAAASAAVGKVLNLSEKSRGF